MSRFGCHHIIMTTEYFGSALCGEGVPHCAEKESRTVRRRSPALFGTKENYPSRLPYDVVLGLVVSIQLSAFDVVLGLVVSI